MGRTMKDFSNNWHDSWLPVLECGVRRVMASTSLPSARLCDPEELVSELWLRCARRWPPELGAQKGCWRVLNAETIKCIAEYIRKPHTQGVAVTSLDVDDRVHNTVPGRYDDFDLVDLADLISIIRKHLTQRQCYVLDKRLMGQSRKQIASELNICHERVRQIGLEISKVYSEIAGAACR